MATIQIDAGPPRIPASLPVYRLERPAVTRKMLLETARQLGLEGSVKAGTLCQNRRLLSYSEGPGELNLHLASGGLRFRDRARWQVDDGRSDMQYDDAAATAIAQRYVEQYGLAPPNECQLQRVTRLHVGAVERQTMQVDQRIIDAGIAFQRVLDGVPVAGQGGKLMLYIDAEGKLTGVERLWRQFRPGHMRQAELRAPDEVLCELEREWGQPGAGLIRVDAIYLAYLESGWDIEQRYLQPVYYLPLSLIATDGRDQGRIVMYSAFWGSALKHPPDRLPTRPPPTPAQTPRAAAG